MNTDLIISLLVPWLFWGGMSALLFYAGRSWFNVLMVAALTNIALLVIAFVASSTDAMWVSLLFHFALLVYFLGSYLRFIIRERRR